MSGSEASNLGYGNEGPLQVADKTYVNVDNSHWSGNFTDTTIPKTNLYGGLRKKINNITKQYKKMRRGSRKIRSLKRKIRNTYSKKVHRKRTTSRRHRKKTHRKHKQRGGYAQYQNNMPLTPSYQVAGISVSAGDSALANPPPISAHTNCVNCVDNYNHYTNAGFPSKGH
jgi:hypothetical protein